MTAGPLDERNQDIRADDTPRIGGDDRLRMNVDDAPRVSVDDAMKDQLRKDIASWREGRSEASTRLATELSVGVARALVPPTTAKMKRAKAGASDVKQAAAPKKPFGMSYDGTSRADYIKLMISRGAR